jgi:predicted glycosyltransferase
MNRSIVFYCHNAFGLGHIMRSALVAAAVRERDPDARLTILTGCRALERLSLPEHVQIEPLPPVSAVDARALRTPDIFAAREKRICDILRDQQPDLLVVDLLATGLNGELLPALSAGEREGWRTWPVLGLPYIHGLSLLRPSSQRVRSIIDHYRAVVAYTDPRADPIFDAAVEAGLPRLRHYAGFVARAGPALPASHDSPPLVVVLNGGGGSSSIFPLVEAALLPLVSAGRTRLRVVAGALNQAPRPSYARGAPGIEFIEAMPFEHAVQGAAVVVSRCGYNSAFGLIQLQLPIVFLPEDEGSKEQRDRGRLLSVLPHVWSVEENNTDALARAVGQALAAGPVKRVLPFSLDGAASSARWLLEEVAPLIDRRRQASAIVASSAKPRFWMRSHR